LTPQAYAANLLTRFPHLTSMEAMARHESAVAKRSWERCTASVTHHTGQIATRHRRQAWAAAIIGMSPISREEAREAWGVTNSAADSRLDSLELGGFATRTEGKPLRWHINTEGRQG
jgi:hypothetical protein